MMMKRKMGGDEGVIDHDIECLGKIKKAKEKFRSITSNKSTAMKNEALN